MFAPADFFISAGSLVSELFTQNAQEPEENKNS